MNAKLKIAAPNQTLILAAESGADPGSAGRLSRLVAGGRAVAQLKRVTALIVQADYLTSDGAFTSDGAGGDALSSGRAAPDVAPHRGQLSVSPGLTVSPGLAVSPGLPVAGPEPSRSVAASVAVLPGPSYRNPARNPAQLYARTQRGFDESLTPRLVDVLA